MSAPFVIRCSREIFSEEEVRILERYGGQFQRLVGGDRTPETEAQRRFIEVARGIRPPETIYERTWRKYVLRMQWESHPANKVAMGELRRMPNDREDWKKMRGALWCDMRRRSKGLDG